MNDRVRKIVEVFEQRESKGSVGSSDEIALEQLVAFSRAADALEKIVSIIEEERAASKK